jgi:staphylococcal nuclease domain-containing protein 1
MASSKKIIGRAVVKMVQSGDQITVRSKPQGGPPKEKVILFSNLTSGKPARRANPNILDSTDTGDEPYAWTARENLRKKIIGQEVYFEVSEEMAGRSYGTVWLGNNTDGENLTAWSLQTGNSVLRESVRKQVDRLQSQVGEDGEESEQLKDYKNLVALEEKAKEEKVGRWADDKDGPRDITWTVSDANLFIDTNRGKEISAIVEHVFNASMVRLYLPSKATYITLSLAGIRAPSQRGSDGAPEAFFELARYTVESKLLGRDLNVIVEGAAPMGSNKEPLFVGTLVHPNGNISELLLKEGFAKCVDWSLGMMTGDVSKYRNAEKSAKMARKRIWKDWQPADASIPEDEREFTGKVIQIINSDSLSVDTGNGMKKIFLSSIRPVRLDDIDESIRTKASKQIDKDAKPLYSVPYLFEAREFLRKKIIGKKVHVKIDYMRQATEATAEQKGFPERACATVTFQGQNLAEALISRGLAFRIRHRQDDDNRSSQYDALIMAEQKAQKAEKGCFSKNLPPTLRVSELDGTKARASFAFLKGKRLDATVDFVFSGSRLKLFVPKETCLITFLIGGIECPRTERPRRDGKPGMEPGDPCAVEAANFTRDLCQQRDVTVEIETMDKVGGFVGYLFVDKINVSVELVRNGLSKVHFSGENGKYANELAKAQTAAQNAKLNIWKNWEPPKEEEYVPETPSAPTARNVNYEKIVITEVTPTLCFYGQLLSNQEALESLTTEMREHFASNAPTAGSYKPKRNDICAAIFPEDGLWYRGKIEKTTRDGSEMSTITFIDYGNRAQVHVTKLAALPAQFSTAKLGAQANEYQLALVKPPSDEDSLNIALEEFLSMLTESVYYVNDENMKEGTTHQVTMMNEAKDDIGEYLLSHGFCTTVKKAPNHVKALHEKYLACQAKAKKQHLNLWRYGDITEDDDKEFGMNSEVVKTK